MKKLSDILNELGIDLHRVESTPSIDDLRIVESVDPLDLNTLDTDCSIMDVPLNLSEGCSFDFDKHVDAIVAQQEAADAEHRARYQTVDWAIENRREWNKRYSEAPVNKMRVRKV